MLTETYGTPAVRALARASRGFLAQPPPDFTDQPLLARRGMLHIARPDQRQALEAAERQAAATVRRLDAAGVRALVSLIAPGYVDGGLLEHDARAIEVNALHQGYLRGMRRRGGLLVTHAAITAIERAGRRWRVDTASGSFSGDLLVDAAGAWADQIARLAGVAPIGLVAKRRTALLIDPPDGLDPRAWPMVIDVDEQFYLKPEGGQLLVSPADETPVVPGDVQPEELDVALAVDRYERLAERLGPTCDASLGGPAQLRSRPRPGGRTRPRRPLLLLAGWSGRLWHHDRARGGGHRGQPDHDGAPARPASA